MIVAHDTYLLICALLTGVVGAYWMLVDSYRLRLALREDRAAPLTRDKLFGSTIGILIGLGGMLGVLKHYYG